ncbi:MAG: GNAT family N-acetyltransferase [Saprospiraceae bacterium]
MTTTLRTDSKNMDFQSLVKLLDAELASRDGAEHSYYAQFNKIDHLNHAVVIFENEVPVACGAMKAFDENSMEVKRMYALENKRGQGFAQLVLAELEKWAAEIGIQRCVLETGKRQPEAIRFYTKSGYQTIPNYGQYIGVENSVCFEKILSGC